MEKSFRSSTKRRYAAAHRVLETKGLTTPISNLALTSVAFMGTILYLWTKILKTPLMNELQRIKQGRYTGNGTTLSTYANLLKQKGNLEKVMGPTTGVYY